MSTSLINFESLPVESLSEVARESFEECNWALEKAFEKAKQFGRILLIVVMLHKAATDLENTK